MLNTDIKYQTYIAILKKQLVPAMGCTEPIALAYCAAKARAILGKMPVRVEIELSGNIIKNVKSVKVPNTNGMHGIKAAAGIGFLAGDSSKELEVIAKAKQEAIDELPEYLNKTKMVVQSVDNGHTLYIEIVGKIYALISL